MSIFHNASAQKNAGIGRYPGNPTENFAPTKRIIPADGGSARYMSAKASSAFDYNLTAQLLADGESCHSFPATLAVYTHEGLLPRRQRECAIDGAEFTRNTLMGESNFLHYQWTGMYVSADHIDITCTMAYHEHYSSGPYDIRVMAIDKDSKGAKRWRTLAEVKGSGLPGVASKYRMHSDPNKQTDKETLPTRRIKLSLPLEGGTHEMSDVRVEFRMKGAAHWTVTQIGLSRDGMPLTTELLPLSRHASAWMSDANPRQWVTLDLGTVTGVSALSINWLKKAAVGHVETSADGLAWTKVADLPKGTQLDDHVSFDKRTARYVKLVLDKPLDDARTSKWNDKCAYCIGEVQVTCDSCADYVACEAPAYHDGALSLNGGEWLLGREAEYSPADGTWREGARPIPATVPATVLTSYSNVGRIPDTNIADNVMDVSDSFFYDNFWYVRRFDVPSEMHGRRVLLNLDGINWKAEVWVNGHMAHLAEGAFVRSKVDITNYLISGANTLAIKIIKNAHPGTVKEKTELNTDFNGGVLGADNPTFHATAGWDWITTVRGRDIGIWNDVYLTATDNVTLDDPVVTTRLEGGKATLTPRVVVSNMLDSEIGGTLTGRIGDISFAQHVTLSGGECREVVFSPECHRQLRQRDMHLWMPNGYGEAYLYDASFEFAPDDGAGSSRQTMSYKCGIREVECRDNGCQLKIYVNGIRVTPLGGNWGMPEQNLNFRRREYDIAVGYHREMNFNMIRNWVGMTGDEEFYDACDRNGIMVWQDFWLANPADGANPSDEQMFIHNACDFTRRMRRHPSITIYCGRNEGYPPENIDSALRQTVARLNPGLTYISSSADEGVSGHGPYWAEQPRTYFAKASDRLHSEEGMPNIMTYDGLARTLRHDQLWPQGLAWGQHDFTQAGAQRGASFNKIIEGMWGVPTSARQYCDWAQWENYEGYRAMFESGSEHRQGLLIWMSHSCWPSLTWQCYDYYFEPTAAFYGCKKACEPLHIQLNALTRNVEVVNRSATVHSSLTAMCDIMDMHGNTVSTTKVPTSANADTTVVLPQLHVAERPDGIEGDVFFVRLSLASADNADGVMSTNLYVMSADNGNLSSLLTLPAVKLDTTPTATASGHITLSIANSTTVPAMMIRLNLKNADGTQILPAHYSDNYFHLMPGEHKSVDIEWDEGDSHTGMANVEITGLNVM